MQNCGSFLPEISDESPNLMSLLSILVYIVLLFGCCSAWQLGKGLSCKDIAVTWPGDFGQANYAPLVLSIPELAYSSFSVASSWPGLDYSVSDSSIRFSYQGADSISLTYSLSNASSSSRQCLLQLHFFADACQNRCVNHQSCVVHLDSGVGSCVCPPNFGGAYCDQELQPACPASASNACYHNGTCLGSVSDPNLFICQCWGPWTGRFCTKPASSFTLSLRPLPSSVLYGGADFDMDIRLAEPQGFNKFVKRVLAEVHSSTSGFSLDSGTNNLTASSNGTDWVLNFPSAEFASTVHFSPRRTPTPLQNATPAVIQFTATVLIAPSSNSGPNSFTASVVTASAAFNIVRSKPAPSLVGPPRIISLVGTPNFLHLNFSYDAPPTQPLVLSIQFNYGQIALNTTLFSASSPFSVSTTNTGLPHLLSSLYYISNVSRNDVIRISIEDVSGDFNRPHARARFFLSYFPVSTPISLSDSSMKVQESRSTEVTSILLASGPYNSDVLRLTVAAENGLVCLEAACSERADFVPRAEFQGSIFELTARARNLIYLAIDYHGPDSVTLTLTRANGVSDDQLPFGCAISINVTATAKVQPRPHPPVVVDASYDTIDLDLSSASSADPDDAHYPPALAYEVECAAVSSSNRTWFQCYTGSSVHPTLLGLNHTASYDVRLRIMNEIGLSQWSLVSTIQTLSLQLDASVTMSETSAILHWQPLEDLVRLDIYYIPCPHSDDDVREFISLRLPLYLNITIVDLLPATAYCFSLYAHIQSALSTVTFLRASTLLPAPVIVQLSAVAPSVPRSVAFAIVFDAATNQPPITSKADLDALLVWSHPIDSNYFGTWLTPSSIEVLISPQPALLPSPNEFFVTVRPSANLVRVGGASLPSSSTSPYLLGPWLFHSHNPISPGGDSSTGLFYVSSSSSSAGFLDLSSSSTASFDLDSSSTGLASSSGSEFGSGEDQIFDPAPNNDDDDDDHEDDGDDEDDEDDGDDDDGRPAPNISIHLAHPIIFGRQQAAVSSLHISLLSRRADVRFVTMQMSCPANIGQFVMHGILHGSQITLTDTLSDLNQTLSNLGFVPASNFSGSVVIHMSLMTSFPIVSSDLQILIYPVNAGPLLSVSPSSVTVEIEAERRLVDLVSIFIDNVVDHIPHSLSVRRPLRLALFSSLNYRMRLVGLNVSNVTVENTLVNRWTHRITLVGQAPDILRSLPFISGEMLLTHYNNGAEATEWIQVTLEALDTQYTRSTAWYQGRPYSVRRIELRRSCVTASPPHVTKIALSSTMVMLSVILNTPVVWPEALVFDCRELFVDATSLGHGPYCTYYNSTCIRARLGTHPSLVPDHSFLTIRPDVLRRCPTSVAAAPSHSLRVLAPPVVRPPVVRLVAPRQVGSCPGSFFEVKAAVSNLPGGFGLYNWSTVHPYQTTQRNILRFSADDLTNSRNHHFSVRVSNLFDVQSDVLDVQVYKSPLRLPFLLPRSSTLRTISSRDQLWLSVQTAVEPCSSDANDDSKLSLAWSVLPPFELHPQFRISSTLQVPPNTLTPGRRYVFTLEAHVIGKPSLRNNVQFIVDVHPERVLAVIGGGAWQQIARSSPLQLSGLQSLPRSDLLSFNWSCVNFLDDLPCIEFSSQLPLQIPPSSSVTLPSYIFRPGHYKIILEVASLMTGTRSQASAVITVDDYFPVEASSLVTYCPQLISVNDRLAINAFWLVPVNFSDFEYEWSVVQGNDVTIPPESNGNYWLVLNQQNAMTFIASSTYRFRVTARSKSLGFYTWSDCAVSVLRQPMPGSIELLSPADGVGSVLDTVFEFEAANWVSPHGNPSLLFQFFYLSLDGQMQFLAPPSDLPFFSTKLLPIGNPKAGYNLTVGVRVASTSYGYVHTISTLNVTVVPINNKDGPDHLIDEIDAVLNYSSDTVHAIASLKCFSSILSSAVNSQTAYRHLWQILAKLAAQSDPETVLATCLTLDTFYAPKTALTIIRSVLNDRSSPELRTLALRNIAELLRVTRAPSPFTTASLSTASVADSSTPVYAGELFGTIELIASAAAAGLTYNIGDYWQYREPSLLTVVHRGCMLSGTRLSFQGSNYTSNMQFAVVVASSPAQQLVDHLKAPVLADYRLVRFSISPLAPETSVKRLSSVFWYSRRLTSHTDASIVSKINSDVLLSVSMTKFCQLPDCTPVCAVWIPNDSDGQWSDSAAFVTTRYPQDSSVVECKLAGDSVLAVVDARTLHPDVPPPPVPSSSGSSGGVSWLTNPFLYAGISAVVLFGACMWRVISRKRAKRLVKLIKYDAGPSVVRATTVFSANHTISLNPDLDLSQCRMSIEMQPRRPVLVQLSEIESERSKSASHLSAWAECESDPESTLESNRESVGARVDRRRGLGLSESSDSPRAGMEMAVEPLRQVITAAINAAASQPLHRTMPRILPPLFIESKRASDFASGLHSLSPPSTYSLPSLSLSRSLSPQHRSSHRLSLYRNSSSMSPHTISLSQSDIDMSGLNSPNSKQLKDPNISNASSASSASSAPSSASMSRSSSSNAFVPQPFLEAPFADIESDEMNEAQLVMLVDQHLHSPMSPPRTHSIVGDDVSLPGSVNDSISATRHGSNRSSLTVSDFDPRQPIGFIPDVSEFDVARWKYD